MNETIKLFITVALAVIAAVAYTRLLFYFKFQKNRKDWPGTKYREPKD